MAGDVNATRRSRGAGALLGLACGDALGRPVTGLSGAEIARRYGRVTEMRADGTRDRPAGAVTGVTRDAVAVARSLLDGEVDGGFDPEGSDRREFDPTERPTATPNRRGDERRPPAAVLVRAVPCAVACDAERLASVVARATGATDGAPAVESSVALARVIAGLLAGDGAATALDDALALAADRGAPDGVRTALAVATDGATASVEGGGAVGTLEAALHGALTAEGVEPAVVAAVNRGGEAATSGAVTGAVAGARFGDGAVPDRWLDHIDGVVALRDLATALAGGDDL